MGAVYHVSGFPFGQATSAGSIPVVLASDQIPLKVQGNDADFSPQVGNPLMTGGRDVFSTNNIHASLITTSIPNVHLFPNILSDINFNLPQYKGTGEIVVHAFSTDNTFANSRYATVDSDGGVLNRQERVAAGVLTSTTVGTSNITLLSANSARKGFIIWNNGAAEIYVKFGATATTSAFGVRIESKAFFSAVYGMIYTGIVDAISSAAGNTVLVTEF